MESKQQYRDLEAGERIIQGDEWLCSSSLRWYPTNRGGATFDDDGTTRYRRRINADSPEASTFDPVNSPPHYNKAPVEVIQLARHLTFDRGNAVKYICRAGVKDPATEVQDLRKAIWYLEDEIQRLTGEGGHAKP